MLEKVGRDSGSDRLRGWSALAADLTDMQGINLAKIWDSNKRTSFTKNSFFLVLYTAAVVVDIVGRLLFSGKADDESRVITLALIRNGHTLSGTATEAVDWG